MKIANVVVCVVLGVAGRAGAQLIAPPPSVPADKAAVPPAAIPAPAPAAPAETPPEEDRGPLMEGPHPVELLRAEGAKLLKHMHCADANRFVFALNWLPVVENRAIYVRKEPRAYLSKAQWLALPEAQRGEFEKRWVDPYEFYFTRYGSPMAYARPVDILCDAFGGGDTSLRGKRILDFGFGGIGQVRLLASIGCEVVGVEVDPFLRALYSEDEDQGIVEGTGINDYKTPDGSLMLLFGSWPSNETMRAHVGEGYDVFLSKNTLKRGYIHPEREANPAQLINLGVSDEEYVGQVSRIVKPGGLWMVYNICPAPTPPDQPYKPWSDGRFPFARELVEGGWDVVAWDQDDAETMRKFARELEWDAGNNPMDLEKDFVVTYTLLRRKNADGTSVAAPSVQGHDHANDTMVGGHEAHQ